MSENGTDELSRLRDECSWLLTAYKGDGTLERALMGLYYSVKATRLAPRIVEVLLDGDPREVAVSGRGDEACYVAETMVRSIHSAGDLLAQVVHVCLVDPSMSERAVSLPNVTQRLQQQIEQLKGTPAQLMASVHAELTALLGSSDYQYVSDFTNTAKHRDYIDRSLVLGDKDCGIAFGAFTKDGRQYPERSFAEVRVAAESIRDHCVKVIVMLEQQRMYDRTIGNGGTLVQDYLSVTATPSITLAGQFSQPTKKPLK